MLLLRKIFFVVLVCHVPAWAQTGSAAPLQDSSTQPKQSSQPDSDPDKNASAEQATPADTGDSTKLIAIKTEKAHYPQAAREKQLQGQVWVRILVSETGDVESTEVISGDPVLADAAVRAVKKWKFKPFLKDGKPVKVSTKLPFSFAFSENVQEEKAPPDGNNAAGASPASTGETPQAVRVSGGVSQGFLVYKVAPVYPPEARRAHIEGVVVLKARISKEGSIVDLELISGPKELSAAAIGAVQQWRYRPYLLLGNPVEVETQIVVNSSSVSSCTEFSSRRPNLQ